MKPLRFDFRVIVLALLAIAIVAVGAVNLREQHRYQLPDDGVFWTESGTSLVAKDVNVDGSAFRAGIRSGDALTSIDQIPVTGSNQVEQILFHAGVDANVVYQINRNGTTLDVPLALTAQVRPHLMLDILRFIGFLYLSVGLFVLLRRYTARGAIHFYLFSMASFVLFVFSYTGKLNNFDWSVYWCSAAALLLQPALYAHFCLAFPQEQQGSEASDVLGISRTGWLRTIYGTAAVLGILHIGVALGFVHFAAPIIALRWILDRLEIGYLAAMFLLGIALLATAYRKAQSHMVRKQMEWVLAGSLVSILPFAAIYAVPFFFGVSPNRLMNLSALSLGILPLALCYAVVRFRMLDIDVALERGAAYTLATAVLIGAYFGVAILAGLLFRNNFPGGGIVGVVIAVIATGILFQPLQRWFQVSLERFFIPKRYDYRSALLDFGRELSAHTDLDQMFAALLEQLRRTLHVKQASIFLAQSPESHEYALRSIVGPHSLTGSGEGVKDRQVERNLGFLSLLRSPVPRFSLESSGRGDYLFLPDFESAPNRLLAKSGDHAAGWTKTLQELGTNSGIHYYFPCRVRNTIVAVLCLGKTDDGEFLWDEDAELVETVAGYLAIAIENVSLLESLVAKATQFERLQELSENILESINVGLLAVDLDDRVEALNTQLRTMAPVRLQANAQGELPLAFRDPNEDLRGRKLSEVLPPALFSQLDRLRDDGGIQNIYRYRITNAIGEDRVLNIAVAPLLSKTCEWIGRLIIFDDVTEKVGLEAKLVQAEKLSSIGLLAAGVAHEVNTPLTVISTQAQMLAKHLPPDDKSLKTMQKIVQQTFRASEIVNSLLNFSRTKATTYAEVNVNTLVSETLLLLEHQFKSSNIVIDSQLDSLTAPVSGNSDKLQQVFLNLFLNAKDAMPQGGRLKVATWSENSHIGIEISDTGVGIAPEHLHRIYDPFFTTKGTGRGTGLGLSVSYGIIHEHGGKIDVQSMPGAGTSFRLEFPASIRTQVHA